MKVEKGKLMEVLRRHKLAFGWTIADFRGISLVVVTHHIYIYMYRRDQEASETVSKVPQPAHTEGGQERDHQVTKQRTHLPNF